jgi:hypothetical protein
VWAEVRVENPEPTGVATDGRIENIEPASVARDARIEEMELVGAARDGRWNLPALPVKELQASRGGVQMYVGKLADDVTVAMKLQNG